MPGHVIVMTQKTAGHAGERAMKVIGLLGGMSWNSTLHRIIYDELCQGRINASSRRVCADIIERMVGNGAEGIVLGCTELLLLIRPGDVCAPVSDTARLHAETAVDLALAEG